MKTEKVIIDGQEVEMVTELSEDDREYGLFEDDLEDTIDLENVVEELKGEENANK